MGGRGGSCAWCLDFWLSRLRLPLIFVVMRINKRGVIRVLQLNQVDGVERRSNCRQAVVTAAGVMLRRVPGGLRASRDASATRSDAGIARGRRGSSSTGGAWRKPGGWQPDRVMSICASPAPAHAPRANVHPLHGSQQQVGRPTCWPGANRAGRHSEAVGTIEGGWGLEGLQGAAAIRQWWLGLVVGACFCTRGGGWTRVQRSLHVYARTHAHC